VFLYPQTKYVYGYKTPTLFERPISKLNPGINVFMNENDIGNAIFYIQNTNNTDIS